jgi:proline iminopeptidase
MLMRAHHPTIQFLKDSPWRTAAGALVVALVAVVAGWVLPRGPVTTREAILALVVAMGVGLAGGWVTRTRWILLVAPVTFMVVFEVVRMRVDGPTVDGIALNGLYGVIAVIGGRGIDAVLMLLPLTVGCAWGVVLVRRFERTADQTSPVRRHLVRRGVLALTTGAVVLLAAGLLRPASTEAIVGANGHKVPGSIAELVDVPIGGHDQAIMLRGVSVGAPVLLFLEGGPGGTGIGRVRNSGEDLEQHFVVATWDQRGTGKSYQALEPTSTMTVEQMVKDTLEVTNYLRDRFVKQKIYVVGKLLGNDPRYPGGSTRPRAVPRLRRHRSDG